jgi:hypothetical protein
MASRKSIPQPTTMFADAIWAEVRSRIEPVMGEALTLEALSKRWKVHPDIARRYVREAALLGEVVKDEENRYTISLSPKMVERTQSYRHLRAEITRRRKENHDRRGASRWDPVEVNLAEQRALLDWIEAQLDKMSDI